MAGSQLFLHSQSCKMPRRHKVEGHHSFYEGKIVFCCRFLFFFWLGWKAGSCDYASGVQLQYSAGLVLLT